MSTKRYCDVCQAEIVDRTDEFKLVLSATRHSVAIRVTPELWPNATTDICRNCLLGALCLAWGERTTGEAVAPKPAEPHDIVGSCMTLRDSLPWARYKILRVLNVRNVHADLAGHLSVQAELILGLHSAPDSMKQQTDGRA